MKADLPKVELQTIWRDCRITAKEQRYGRSTPHLATGDFAQQLLARYANQLLKITALSAVYRHGPDSLLNLEIRPELTVHSNTSQIYLSPVDTSQIYLSPVNTSQIYLSPTNIAELRTLFQHTRAETTTQRIEKRIEKTDIRTERVFQQRFTERLMQRTERILNSEPLRMVQAGDATPATAPEDGAPAWEPPPTVVRRGSQPKVPGDTHERRTDRADGRQTATPGHPETQRTPPAASAGHPPTISSPSDVNNLADQVIRVIDQRIIAQRERLGRL